MNRLLILLLLLVSSACKETFPKQSFTVVTPTGWTRKDTIVSLGNKVILMTNPGRQEEIMIFDGYSKTREEFTKPYYQELVKRSSFFQLPSAGEIRANNRMIMWMDCVIRYKSDDKLTYQRTYFVSNKPYRLGISFITLKGKMNLMQPVIDEVISSIVFK